jgi:hypothetical protein
VVVTVGLTTTTLPVNAPGFHVYDVAPLAVSVEFPPTHIAVGDALAVTVGLGVTTCVKVIVLVQPNALVAVNVYTVVTEGETTTALPVSAPGFHV